MKQSVAKVRALRTPHLSIAFVRIHLVSSMLAAAPTLNAFAADLVKTEVGKLPIILSAPHGGSRPIPGAEPRTNRQAYRFTTGRDVGTDRLTDALADELEKRLGKRPFVVRAEFHRRYLDANRAPADAFESEDAKAVYEAYHRALAESCEQVRKTWGRGLLLDLHGQVAHKEKVLRGTNDGKTVRLLRQRFGEMAHFGPESLMGRLAEQGLSIHPTKADEKEIPGFRGGYIVQTYGSHERFGIDAIQLEFGSQYRTSEAVPKVAAQVASGVEKFARQYLPLDVEN